jgi:hypothetical protein
MPDPNDRRLIKGATVVVEPDGAVRSIDTVRNVRYGYKAGDTTIFYFGTADPHHIVALDTDPVWQVAELNITSGALNWADFAQFNQIWDNRESLVYG